ncbi:radical sam [Lucifera butyrica]|uniref:Probable dual-specificity RNA methyltransferase RlmN n=1 Tax=Lucifera butyrica TaxID=1351585 RepID=A0A498RCS7_9FIRM|nr:23S rRNA (adenine(2503)-C(2))-methyltransferase RlmN [Lucifera butyrica]VBB07942.1 radical sam [Lucifera butyrica]
MKNIFGLFEQEIEEEIKPYGLEPYRAGQIAAWIYRQGKQCFEDMTNLSRQKRELLAAHFSVQTVTTVASRVSGDGKTSKFLLSYPDGAAVETVLMRQPYGNSVCISTQVGCAMGCIFCASTLRGVTRNLAGGEILAQVLFIQNQLAREQCGVDSIVIMGSGEPLANYENVLRFMRLCHEPYCLNMSYRNITLSTSGIVPEIYKLAAEKLPVTLSISLHAPNNDLRSQLMPVNRSYSIADVMAAADYYTEVTGRRVTYEYILIAGLNDRPEHARQLASLIKGRIANVNLIPVNPVPERGLLRPDDETIERFFAVMKKQKVNTTIRREMGVDIQAACGQLRHELLAKQLDNFD